MLGRHGARNTRDRKIPLPGPTVPAFSRYSLPELSVTSSLPILPLRLCAVHSDWCSGLPKDLSPLLLSDTQDVILAGGLGTSLSHPFLLYTLDSLVPVPL